LFSHFIPCGVWEAVYILDGLLKNTSDIQFYNVFEISRILQEYIQAGNTLESEIIGALSPYLTKHINRFGSYSLDLNRKPPILDFGFSLIFN
jgi:hypothetical protein